ncbi:protein of unknown function [Pseudomonas mediterranea]
MPAMKLTRFILKPRRFHRGQALLPQSKSADASFLHSNPQTYDQITRAPPANDAFVWPAGLSTIGLSPVP